MIAERSGIALEWWLARQFGTPDVLAEEILLERVREGAPELATALREVRAAAVPAENRAHAELALDRQALLAQAAAWHYLEGADVRPALAGLRRWLRQFAVAYGAHALAIRARTAALRAELERDLPRVRALERLDSIRALGRPVGQAAAIELRSVLEELIAFEPTPASAPLEVEPALFARAFAALEGVRAALERQRARLAAATVRAVLDRRDVDKLDRLLQAIRATDLDGIERALDSRLAAHIEEVLGGVPLRSPLEALAVRYPEVRAGDVDEVAAELRALLTSALEGARGDTVALA